MGVGLAIVVALIFVAIVFLYKNKLNAGSSCIDASAGIQATTRTKSAGEKAAYQAVLGGTTPEPDVNTAQKPTTEEMNKYAYAAAEGSNRPETDVLTAKDPTKEELEIALKKKAEAGSDLIELPGEAAVKEGVVPSAVSMSPPEMASASAQPGEAANPVAPTA